MHVTATRDHAISVGTLRTEVSRAERAWQWGLVISYELSCVVTREYHVQSPLRVMPGQQNGLRVVPHMQQPDPLEPPGTTAPVRGVLVLVGPFLHVVRSWARMRLESRLLSRVLS